MLRCLAALVGGVVLSLAFEPVGLAVLMPVALAVLVLAVRGLSAAGARWSAGSSAPRFMGTLVWWMRAVGTDAWAGAVVLPGPLLRAPRRGPRARHAAARLAGVGRVRVGRGGDVARGLALRRPAVGAAVLRDGRHGVAAGAALARHDRRQPAGGAHRHHPRLGGHDPAAPPGDRAGRRRHAGGGDAAPVPRLVRRRPRRQHAAARRSPWRPSRATSRATAPTCPPCTGRSPPTTWP